MKKERKYYITMTDKFMSGWGDATGKINKLVIECENPDQAFLIEKNARKRYEMKYVNFCTTKPNRNPIIIAPKSKRRIYI